MARGQSQLLSPFQVNDYLARRDCEWVGQVHRFLGLTVGLVQQGMKEGERKVRIDTHFRGLGPLDLPYDLPYDHPHHHVPYASCVLVQAALYKIVT